MARRDLLSPDRGWVRVVRFAFGVLALAGVAWNVERSALGLTGSTLWEALSQFTNQANFGIGVVLVTEAFARRDRLPRWWDHLRGAMAFYLVMTGLIYALLVAAPGEMLRWDLEWSNLALHRLLPAFALVDWLLISMRARGGWGRPLAFLIYPVLYLIFTWVRGAIVGWYPYPFLNPLGEGGWGAVAQLTSVVLVAFLAVALLMHLLGNARAGLRRR